MIEVRAGSRAGRQDLKRETGTGSRGQALIGDPLMSSSTSAWDRSLKDENVVEADGSGKELRLELGAARDDFILDTFSSKNERKSWARVTGSSWAGRVGSEVL